MTLFHFAAKCGYGRMVFFTVGIVFASTKTGGAEGFYVAWVPNGLTGNSVAWPAALLVAVPSYQQTSKVAVLEASHGSRAIGTMPAPRPSV